MPSDLDKGLGTTVAPGDDVVDVELCGMEAVGSESHHFESLVVGIKMQLCEQEPSGVESCMLSGKVGTLEKRTGRICLYLLVLSGESQMSAS